MLCWHHLGIRGQVLLQDTHVSATTHTVACHKHGGSAVACLARILLLEQQPGGCTDLDAFVTLGK